MGRVSSSTMKVLNVDRHPQSPYAIPAMTVIGESDREAESLLKTSMSTASMIVASMLAVKVPIGNKGNHVLQRASCQRMIAPSNWKY